MEPYLMAKAFCCNRLISHFLYILYHNFVEKSKIISPTPTRTPELVCTGCVGKFRLSV